MADPLIWIGLVEVRPHPGSNTLGAAKGGATNVVTWAADVAEFRSKAETLMTHLGLELVEVEDAESVDHRVRAGYVLSAELVQIIAETEVNPQAIRFSTFHTWSEE